MCNCGGIPLHRSVRTAKAAPPPRPPAAVRRTEPPREEPAGG